jgi:molybdopterin biosynthesis enzyme MoaB
VIAPPPFNFIESLIERRARASSCFLAAFFGLIHRVAFPFVTLVLVLPKSDDRDCLACFFGRTILAAALIELVDNARCDLVLTTGGTGPAPRDVTPEATLAVASKVMPGFGEQMRAISLRFVPTAILSRQVAVVRGHALIINLPGQPKSIAETLEGLPAATPPAPGIFAAVPYCVDLIGGPYIETDEAVCKAFRPKSALRVR